MSMDLGALVAGQTSYVQTQKALRAWIQVARLGDKWETISFRRGATYLDPQTVRLEFHGNLSAEASSAAGTGFAQKGVLFGLKNHPTLPDLDAKEFDTFVLGTEEYTITHVNRTLLGQMQCQFEVV